MDITIVVGAAAVMTAPILTLVDAPPLPVGVPILIPVGPVGAHTVTVTTIQLVTMMTN